MGTEGINLLRACRLVASRLTPAISETFIIRKGNLLSFMYQRNRELIMKRILIVLAVLILTGCGIRHDVVHISSGQSHVSPSAGKPIVLDSVSDERAFIADGKLSAIERAQNVGGLFRGGADVAVDLESGTVVDKSREIITQALRGMGYVVMSKNDAPTNAIRIKVDVTKFDVNAPFEFWRSMGSAQRMVAVIECKVEFTDSSARQGFTTAGHGSNVFQRLVPENWEIALNRAVDDFAKKFQDAMASSDNE